MEETITAQTMEQEKPRTLSGELKLSEALHRESNVLQKMQYPAQERAFRETLASRCHLIEATAAQHLGVGEQHCQVSESKYWLRGSFNICIPVHVRRGKTRAESVVIMRFPLPYRVGDAFRPGNADEKLRCEAATYAWIHDTCPSLPIPQLYGFALSTGQKFTALERLPMLPRFFHFIARRLSAWSGHPPNTTYVRRRRQDRLASELGTGYLLIEYIDQTRGEMLSSTWEERRQSIALRANLFRGLSRILLTLARVPLPTIGSFTIDNNGYLNLTNRPLMSSILSLENERILTGIARDSTYTTVDTAVADLLSLHDRRLEYQPNAANDKGDCVLQVTALTGARAVFPTLFRRDLRSGPFIFTLTDLHQSNIFVDDQWNITAIIDLEFACSLPIEFQAAPYWLSNEAIDTIQDEEFEVVRSEFMAILAEEEEQQNDREQDRKWLLSSVVQQSWETGTFWASSALQCPRGFTTLFLQRVAPLFDLGPKDINHTAVFTLLAKMWRRHDSLAILDAKAADKVEYDARLKQVFGVPTLELVVGE